MILIRRVRGTSMHPTLREGDLVFGWRRDPRLGDIVVARQGDREVIKRVEKIEGDKLYLVGDNRQESTDSRHYGSLNKSNIRGTVVVVFRLPLIRQNS